MLHVGVARDIKEKRWEAAGGGERTEQKGWQAAAGGGGGGGGGGGIRIGSEMPISMSMGQR